MFCHAHEAFIHPVRASTNRFGASHGAPCTVASDQLAACGINRGTINNIVRRNFCTPHRNAVTPPQLSADAPIANVLMPMLECLCIARRVESDFTVADGRRVGSGAASGAMCSASRRSRATITLRRIHRTQRSAAQAVIGDADVPLFAQVRLNRHVTSITVTNAVPIGLHALKQAVRLEPRNNRCTRVFTREANEGACLRGNVFPTMTVGDGRIGRHDIDRGNSVTNANLPVIGVMRGSDFQESSCKLRLGIGRVAALLHSHDHVVIFHNWNDATNDGEAQLLASHRRCARVLRVERHSGIAKHGLRSRGRHCHVPRSIFKRIAEVPEVAVHFFHLHFIIGKRGA